LEVSSNRVAVNLSLVRQAARTTLLFSGRLYRSSVLTRSRFVVVTGSCGKTTAKELTAAVLSTRFRVFKSPANGNLSYHFIRFMFRIRPSHECCVIEAAGGARTGPVDLDGYMGILRPDVSVVTNIGLDHYTTFRTREAVAVQKGKVVDALSPDGIAVLNADDPYVLSLASRCKGKVVTFGAADHATMRATEIDASFPNPLSFLATCNGESVRMQTRLHGAHVIESVLAALTVGHVMGVPLSAAVEAIGRVKPYPGRMQPVETADGITFMCDQWKAPLWTMPHSLEFLRAARARRKVLVIGTISDYAGDMRKKYKRVAQTALESVDALIGFGANATAFLRATPTRANQVLSAFADASQALAFLRGYLEPGDLVLLKGSEGDNLELIVKRWHARPAAQDAEQSSAPAPTAAASTDARPRSDASAADLHLIVGLGNPREDLADTPHNVGQRAVDALAARLGAAWTDEGHALTAESKVGARPVKLVKLKTWMNASGPALHDVAERLQVNPERCIVLFDDMDLPLGSVRSRATGSSGGHRGLASILIAFQSQKVPRVKIGVGRPPEGDAMEFVTRPFTIAQREVIAAACEEAASAVIELVKRSAAN
jgi:UDP-N-acetylmuramoyl-tripeptide--D-alanyl-D-alanine ligase